MVNAIKQNNKAGKVVRGGSTLTQQVIRLSRKGKGRTYFEKLIEIILSTRLELGYSKNAILEMYAAHAPFGGNVVGLEMASWRYFGVQSNQLSWAENATLAVLPNAPSLIYPGKNQIKLLNKRNRLLLKLHQEGIIDKQTYELFSRGAITSKTL
jgi:penicillin-binding protein 1C